MRIHISVYFFLLSTSPLEGRQAHRKGGGGGVSIRTHVPHYHAPPD
eukprot:gene4668-3363_t